MRKVRRRRCDYDFPEPKILGTLEKDQFYCYIQYKPSGKPFYVGKGKDLRYRSNYRNQAYKNTVEKYGELYIETHLFPVDSENEAFQWEKELIYSLRCQGFKLVNQTDGGDGVSGHKVSIKTRRLLRKIHKGKPKPALREFNKTRRNSIVIDTPWGKMGLYDASVKTGVSYKVFLSRYEDKMPPEKLFNPKPNRSTGRGFGHKQPQEARQKMSQKHHQNFVDRCNARIIDTPWGKMGAHDAAQKAKVDWPTFEDRLSKNKPFEKLFKPTMRDTFMEREESFVIKTPWGPMGRYSAAKKAGILWKTFRQRLLDGKTGDDLFRKPSIKLLGFYRHQEFLRRVNHKIIDTPWGPMPQYDASVKFGVKWNAFSWRVAKNLPMEELFNKANYRESALLPQQEPPCQTTS